MRIALVLVLIGATSCGGTEPPNTPLGNFDALWSEFDALYALFPEKHLNWATLRREYRPRAETITDEVALRALLAELTGRLHDGHVSLKTPAGTVFSDSSRYVEPHHFDPDLVRTKYLDGMTTLADGRLVAAKLRGTTVGYIAITSFADEASTEAARTALADALDDALEQLRGVTGLVLDLRDNPGGSPLSAFRLAGRFADVARTVAFTQTRAGPSHDDLTPEHAWTLEPRGPWRFDGPVRLLTNRFTFSASEWFAMMMKELPTVRQVGTRTGGGLGIRVARELPVGWTYTLTVAKTVSARHESFDEIGLPPDLALQGDASEPDRDAILDAAIADLLAE